ncbi:MAG: DUF6569 family protein [Syntrophobacteraceae bacterium]|jgi:hypothetical protein
MSILQDVIPRATFLGNLRGFQGLGTIPILTKEIPELQELDPVETALEKGLARLTETGPVGEVPFLMLENTGDCPIIILDGEEVVGGKQNRIINTTMVIPASTSVKIPVSCIQAGRWQHERADFDSAGSVFRARSRAAQVATVTANVRESGSFRSDQGTVWDEVSASLLELGVHSETSDFREGRERVADRLEEFVEAIRPIENQIGSIFISAQSILGLEMLGTPVLFSQVCDKVTRSFAFEALNAPDLNGASTAAAKEWWDTILKSPFTQHASPAAGEDIRVGTEDLVGSGLIWNDVVVHFSCFPNLRMENHRPSQRRASAGQRRRNLRSSQSD